MIGETILFLTLSNCEIPALEKHGLGVGINNSTFAAAWRFEKWSS